MLEYYTNLADSIFEAIKVNFWIVLSNPQFIGQFIENQNYSFCKILVFTQCLLILNSR